MSRYRGGLRSWVWQRISAVYLALFTFSLLALFLFAPPQDYQAWKNVLQQPLVSVAFLLFVMALLVHAWVGARDVLMDYIHSNALLAFLSLLLASLLISCAGWVVTLLV